MNPKKIVVFSIIGIVAVYIYAFVIDFNGCGKSLDCYPRLMGSTLISPFFNSFLALTLSTFPFIFLKNIDLYKTWEKIFYIWLSLTLIILIFGEYSPSGGGFGVTVSVTNKEVVYILSIFFILISWLIAFWGYVKRNKY